MIPRCGTLCQTIAGAPGLSCRKTGIAKELLSPKGDHQLQFMIIDIPAQIRSDEVLTGYGEKAGLLLEGELTLEIEGNSTVLYPGDSFQFKSSLRHNVFNHTHSGAKVLWIMHIQPENHL